MPSSSRGASPLRTGALKTFTLYPALPGLADPPWAANTLFGATITAVPDPDNARVRVDVSWPPITSAEVWRVHEDGTTLLVRGGNPAILCTAWARWDYEAPLDQTLIYRVTSPQAPSGSYETGPVMLATGAQAWLGHTARPYLQRRVEIREVPTRSAVARRGKANVLDREDPITVHQTRQTDTGSVVLRTDGTMADVKALRALLADGAPLILRMPGVWGGECLYISVDTTPFDRWAARLGSSLEHHVTLPFDVLLEVDGDAYGFDGGTYTDQAATYHSYNALAAGAASYIELSMMGG